MNCLHSSIFCLDYSGLAGVIVLRTFFLGVEEAFEESERHVDGI